MNQSAKAQEPSMEEILASIRRIISDEEPKAAAAPRPAPRAVVSPPPVRAPEPRDQMAERDIPEMAPPVEMAPEPINDILDLTEQMAQPAPPPSPEFRTIDGAQDIVFAESDPHSPAHEQPTTMHEPRPAPPPEPPLERPPLMSQPTVAAVDSAFNTLAHTVLVQNARTLEDLVKEMLRPMLKSWLDDNLPGLVERLVRAEIERVSRGRNP
jgi:cell pole-organizing protein PopZ